MRKFKIHLISFSLAIGLVACAGTLEPNDAPANDAPAVDTVRGTFNETQIDATSYDDWQTFDIDGDEVWDLSFQRSSVRVNGGVSGTANVQALALGETAFADVTQAPDDGYSADASRSAPDEAIRPDSAGAPHPVAPDDIEYVFGDWYSYDFAAHVLRPKDKVYVLIGSTGKAFKLQFTAYYREGTPGFPSFRWQPIQRPNIGDLSRIISVGGAVTETLIALGMAPAIVAVDTTSVFPSEVVSGKKKIGFMRQLSAESILALRPTQVIASAGAGPAHVFEQLKAAGIQVTRVPEPQHIDAAYARIETLGKVVQKQRAAQVVIEKMRTDYDRALASRPKKSTEPRVLFIYARGQGTVYVAGRDTAIHTLIEAAGGHNAIADVQGFKPLNAEHVVAAKPDVLVMLSRGAASLGSRDNVFQLPGLALTPAGREKRLVLIDDLKLLGFGPRAGQALAELVHGIHA